MDVGQVDKKRLTSVLVCHCCVGLPLCWKAFSENTTPHQQHWANRQPSSRLLDNLQAAFYFRLYVSFPLDGISSTLPPLRPSGTGRHAASVAPFMGPDSSLTPLRWMFTALRCRDLAGSSLASSLAKSFTVSSRYVGKECCRSGCGW